MNVEIRTATPTDIEVCGKISHEAFTDIDSKHGFPSGVPTPEFGALYASYCIGHPAYFNVVAELDQKVVGACYLEERSPIRGVAIVAVEPGIQGRGIGRKLMQAILERCDSAVGVRLLQETFNSCSMSLYTSVGFDTKEPIALLDGKPQGNPPAGYEVRPMMNEDLDGCRTLSQKVYGFDRTDELQETIKLFKPFVALSQGRIVAYTSAVDAWWQNYSIAEEEEDMRALILGLGKFYLESLKFLLPIRQASLFRWFLSNNFRIIKPYMLMAMGEYHDPKGYYLTSVNY